MKTQMPLFLIAAALVPLAALSAAPEPALIVERGPHSRTWQRVTRVMLNDGRAVDQTNSYVEIGGGICYFKDGQWRDSKAQFQLFPGGAIAQEGPMQLILTPDIAEEGSVDLLMAEGKRFRSSPRWLAYYDPATGQSAIVAAVKSCVGELVEPNVVVYSDAFDDLKAALRYEYHSWGMDQSVILLESGSLRPEDYGLNPNNPIVLEMWSEFHEWAEPDKTVATPRIGLGDVRLEFGTTHIGDGKAFSLEDEETAVDVGKTWTQVDRRQFLIESVRQADLAPLLVKLPQQAQANNPAQRGKALAQRNPVNTRAALLAQAGERLRLRERKTQTAAIQRTDTRLGQGVAIDYSVVATASGVQFKNETYLVLSDVTFSGTTTIWGGACIKFTNWSSSRLKFTGPIDCRTSSYRPAFFVGKDDDSIGELINGSSGNPETTNYAGRAMELNAANTLYQLHDLRFRNFDKAITVSSSTATNELSHSQIGQGNIALYSVSGGPSRLRNVLIHNITNTALSSATVNAENVTFHRVNTFRSGGTVNLTNCLVICATNTVTWNNAANTVALTSDTGIFQSVGAGARYLANGSTNRNAGTTNINPMLAADLKQRTTYPPIVLSSDFLYHTTLGPQAMRDTDVPDLGYHADPLDWCWSGKKLTNVTLTLTNGVAVAFYDSAAALKLYTGSKVVSRGLATSLNRIVPYFAVQEGQPLWGSARPGALFELAESSPSVPPEIDLRFTAIDLFQGDSLSQQPFLISVYSLGRLCLTDSQLRGGYWNLVPQYNYASQQLIALTNTTVQWTYMNLHQGYLGDTTPVVLHFRNNLFCTNVVSLMNSNTSIWTAHDNLFDTVILLSAAKNITNSNNGYCNTTVLPGSLGTNVTLTAVDYQDGPLARWYYPTSGVSGGLTNLLNKGSRNATTAGLYSFTTTTNQFRETNSIVDIGAHFLAVTASIQPIDTDGDGIPDYLEDLNGNGSYDAASGETDWQTYNSILGIGSGPGLVVFTPLK